MKVLFFRLLLTGNSGGILCLMEDLHEIDRIEERMVLDVFTAIGHTAQSCGHINN